MYNGHSPYLKTSVSPGSFHPYEIKAVIYNLEAHTYMIAVFDQMVECV
ncbi:hypothetical protein ACFPFV_00070 [Salinicoccus siamensis]